MKKILTILGARPQFIKASVVSKEIAKSAHLKEVIVHTGQHFDKNMSDIFFTELNIMKPNYFLGVNSETHGVMTGRMLIDIERVLLIEKPDLVLVYGDTNSTLAGALAAVKLNIPIAHVEAGLRSFNMTMPEEINRILTDRISNWLFAPSVHSINNLRNEGFREGQIIPVGDVMFDVAIHFGSQVESKEGLLGRLHLIPKSYLLVTIHRAENTNIPERLISIINALELLATTLPIVWPLHPRTRAFLKESGQLERISKKIILINPVGYLDMVQLEKYAALIATDSGGVQKEAFFYKVPCVTLRDETEWIELVESGWNHLVSPENTEAIVRTIKSSLGNIGKDIRPYGEGNASELIIKALEKS